MDEHEVDISAGVEFLDGHAPGWASNVDPGDDFFMEGCNACVLGQLYGWYFDGLVALALDPEDRDEQERLGFTATPASRWAELTDAWRQEILGRQAAAA